MIQLCYISTARPHVTWDSVDEILSKSRRNNEAARVTGLLLFNGKRFLQLLEGDPAAVEATYARIQKDSRHFAVVRLSERTIEDREFGEWSMSFQRFQSDESKVRTVEQVQELTRTASPHVRALFTSYASI